MRRAPLLPWLLIALAPVFFALLTWNTSNTIIFAQAWMRFFGAPVAAVELVVIAYAVLAGVEPLKSIEDLPTWAKALLAMLVAIGLWTALFVAPQTLQSVSWTFLSVIHMLFGVSVAALVSETDLSISSLIWPTILGGLCGYALIFLVFVNSIPNPSQFEWEHFRLAVTNVRQVGFYSAVGAAAALGLSVTSGRGRALLYGVAASALLSLSFWTGTRGSLIAIVVAFTVGFFLLPQLRTVRAWATLFGSMACGAALSLLQPQPHSLFGIGRIFWSSTAAQSADVLSSGRLVIWRGTWQAIRHRPLFGYGEGQFLWVVPESNGFSHPHNVVLQLLLQWGFVGTLAFAALASVIALRLYRSLTDPRSEQVAPFLVLASMLTMSLYEGTFFHTYPLMMIAFSVGMLGQKAERAS